MSDVTVAEARARLLAAVEPGPAETVPLGQASGRVLAERPRARFDRPGADVATMDGYAVRALDIVEAAACGSDPVLAVVDESAAGHPSTHALLAGAVMRISTGAALPAGADAVIAQEDTVRDGGTLRVLPDGRQDLVPGRFVRGAGTELRRGEDLLPEGHRLAPGDIALLAGAGLAEVSVVRRPRVAIVATGDELRPLGVDPGRDGVPASNGIMLAALVEGRGVAELRPDVPDDPARTLEALRDALSADVVLVTGGVSVGDHDHVRPVLAQLGGVPLWPTVAMRPGKPTTAMRIGECIVLALPGNPASAWVAFLLFGVPALARREGERDPLGLPERTVELAGAAPGAGRRAHYVRARWTDDGRLAPLPRQISGDLRSISDVDAMVVVPAGTAELAAGTTARAIVVRDRRS